MPIFNQTLKKLDGSKPQEAIAEMAKHIKYIQEQLEWTLMNLDSTNITEIETDKTDITSSSGSVNMTGETISLKGQNGESFTVGKGTSGGFTFALNGKGGIQALYLASDGNIYITKHANISLDCGEW